MKRIAIVILSCLLLAACGNKKDKTCYLTGKVIDRDSKTLILIKQTEDERYNGVYIPIDSTGSFNYRLNAPVVEAYELIFKDENDQGAWRPILFFNDADAIQFILYPMERADSNKVIGSKLSLKEKEFVQKLLTRFEKQFEDLNRRMDSIEISSETNAADEQKLFAESDSLREEILRWQLRYLKDEAGLYGYSKFLKILLYEKSRINAIPFDTLRKYEMVFRKKFPGHPYNSVAQNLISSLENIKVGGFYVDFTAPDSNGTNFLLSDIVSKNKLTLIDLWAPWCGPCIRKSKKTVPVFEEFKGSGFAVVGVVGGISSKEQFQKAIRKHPYPWILLSEISDKNKIWEKYNIANSGGSQFLVDRQGKILAINPSPEELKEFILKRID